MPAHMPGTYSQAMQQLHQQTQRARTRPPARGIGNRGHNPLHRLLPAQREQKSAPKGSRQVGYWGGGRVMNALQARRLGGCTAAMPSAVHSLDSLQLYWRLRIAVLQRVCIKAWLLLHSRLWCALHRERSAGGGVCAVTGGRWVQACSAYRGRTRAHKGAQGRIAGAQGRSEHAASGLQPQEAWEGPRRLAAG